MRATPMMSLFFSVFLAASVTAQEAPGRLIGTSCGAMPANPSVEIVLLDNVDANVRIKNAFVDGLRRRGVAVQAGAALMLTLEIVPVREFEGAGESNYAIELRVGQANRDLGQQGDVNLRGSVWSSSENSLVGGPRKGSPGLAVDRVRLTASLNSRVDGHFLWQGEAVHELNGRELEPVAMALVPSLVGAFGKTVTPRPITIEATPSIR
jgi:hypothetical protein